MAVAIIGVVIVRGSFAATKWPYYSYNCGVTTNIDRNSKPPVLKQGNRGECVKLLQDGLRATGFMSSSADGVFGPKTADSVLVLETYYRFGFKDRVASKCDWLTLQGIRYYGKTNVNRVKNYVISQGGNCF